MKKQNIAKTVKRGKVIVVTGPSGVGKTEISKSLLKSDDLNLQRVVTCTTRAKREGEIDGKDYFFLTRKEFLKNIKSKKMFEYAEVYGNFYGSRKKDVLNIIESGKNVLFTVDVRGALSLKRIDSACKVIFIGAENTEELKNRLLGRGTDSSSIIKKRVNSAIEELKMASKFDYVVINYNGKIKQAISNVRNIINCSSLKK